MKPKLLDGLPLVRRREILTPHFPQVTNTKAAAPFNPLPTLGHQQHLAPPIHGNPTFATDTSKNIAHESQTPERAPKTDIQQPKVRDDGVPDEGWTQLQRDKLIALRDARNHERQILDQKSSLQHLREAEAEAKLSVPKIHHSETNNQAKLQELKRRQEAARLQEQNLRIEQEKARAELERLRAEDERRKKDEVRVQTKLREMGVCPVGYRWIKQGEGYRCAGGSHFVSNAALGV